MLKSQRFDEWAGTGINFSEPFNSDARVREEAAGGK